MNRSVRVAAVLVLAAFTQLSAAWTSLSAQSDEISARDIGLVEHSGEIFFATVDIVTYVREIDLGAGGGGCVTGYTVLISEVLKGNLKPQSIIVVDQTGCATADLWSFHDGDGPMTPGSEYLFFARFVPGLPAYQITEPVAGNIPVTSSAQRGELIDYWTRVVDRTACPVTDVLKLDGVVYTRRDWNEDKRYLEREWVGPTIATVEWQDTTATGCREDMLDRSASVIPAGTKVQELDGYATTFRVGVRMPDRHRYLYEAIWNEDARTGADLLDIDGRAISLTVEQPLVSDCGTGYACDPTLHSTDDPALINQVITILRESPVDPRRANWRNLPPRRLELRFTLDDDSTVDLVFSLRTGLSQGGIEVPLDDLEVILWRE